MKTETIKISVRDKIRSGQYTVKGDLTRPQKPALLRMSVDDMNIDQLKQLVDVKIAYDKAMTDHQEQLKTYRQKLAAQEQQFHQDLLKENGIPANCEFGARMFGLAWESGHSAGYEEIVSHFEDLLPLYELYKKK